MPRAKILEVRASGALVLLLDNNKTAWIKGDELSTQYDHSKKLSDQGLCFKEDVIDVVVYGREIGGEQRMLASHIRYSNDPWKKVENWTEANIKEMKVSSVTPSRAFGWIEPGIQGFIELKELDQTVKFLRSWANFKNLYAGDIIAGYVQPDGIESDHRLVKLDAGRYIKNLRHITEFLPIIKRNIFSSKESFLTPTNNILEKHNENEEKENLPPGVQCILVVDDDPLFLREICTYLTNCGINVIKMQSKNQVMRYLESPECLDFDVAILDVNLAEGFDSGGFEVAKTLSMFQPRCKIIMATGGDHLDSKKIFKIASDLPICNLIYKPLGIEDLNIALSSIVQGNTKKLENFVIQDNETKINTYSQKGAEDGSLYDIFSELKAEIFAESIVLFRIHPLSYEVKIEAHVGVFRNKFEENLPRMRYSPVKDVAIDKEIIFEDKITNTPKFSKHRRLAEVMPYESCIGIPIPFRHEWKYCLFAFHGNKDFFDESDIYKVKSAAKHAALIMKIRKLEETIRNENPFYLAGKTYGSMAHDLIGALNREFGIHDILELIKKKSVLGAHEIRKVSEYLGNLRAELRRAQKIVSTFRQMSRSQYEKEVEFDVLETIINAIKSIKVETDALNTEIIIYQIKNESQRKVKMKKSGFEQVIYNMFLNAAQQVDRFSFAREKGYIMVELAKIHLDNKNFIQIFIHDSGPGIHVRDFERIFEKGYTTKDDGCGMGLDICRSILKQAGGKIRVLKSILFCGTTFEILLPLI